MIRKGKLLKNTAIALAIISVFGSTLSSVSAAELNNNNIMAISQFLDDNYDITEHTTLLKDNTTSTSMANKYLDSSVIIVENGKMKMKITFNEGDIVTKIIPKIDGKEVAFVPDYNASSKQRSVIFDITSLSDNIKLDCTMFGTINAACIVSLDTSKINIPTKGEEDDAVTSPTPSVPEGGDSTDEEDTTIPPTTGEEDNSTGSDESTDTDSGNGTNNSTDTENGASTTETSKNGYYQLKNILHLDNPTGYAMVRSLLSETTNMEVKNGKTYITLRMSMASQMSNIKIKVDGKNVNFTKTNVGNDTLEFKIEVPSTSSKLTFSMFVAAMGQNVDFKVSFNESTIKFISSNEEPIIPSTGTTIGGSTTDTTTSTDTDTKVESNTVKGKLYTIQNQIISSSTTGQQMARKYTNSTTKIEEVNGKMYATLTFTGVDLMSNHKIYVNGSVVSHSITSRTSSSVSLRFAIPNVSADIKVQAYIIPMKNTVTYGVKLLENTLKFVKDFETENGTLPQTGSLINSETVMASGGLLAMSGVLLRRKRK